MSMFTLQHPDDAAVDRFAAAMKEKLAEARAKGRGGWEDKSDCPQQRLSDMLRGCLEKGDPRDVANFCMFMWARGEAILPRSRSLMDLRVGMGPESAKPAARGEAVVFNSDSHVPDGFVLQVVSNKRIPDGTKLYTHPVAAGVPVWQPIETAPKDGRTLLLGYRNAFGKWRTLRGRWISRGEIEQHWEDDDFPEGWYEEAVEAEEPDCWPTDPTHWIPLPDPPAEGEGEGLA